jgi:hypothetical protein
MAAYKVTRFGGETIPLTHGEQDIINVIRSGRIHPREIAAATGLSHAAAARKVRDLARKVGAPSVEEFISAVAGHTVAQDPTTEFDLRARKPEPEGPPPLVDDVSGESREPDPARARTPEEFIVLLRAFWEWAGRYPVRDLAAWSGGAFSHTTINNLLAEAPRTRPPVTLRYVQGLIRACGGQGDRVQRWTTAWRRIYLPAVSAGAAGEVISLPNRAVNG